MQRQWRVLVTAQLENRQSLIRILDGLPINAISASSVKEARQALSSQPADLIFCDEFLPDGSYEDFLSPAPAGQFAPRVVVITRIGEWEDYLEATRRGAFDVIRCPLQSTDIELAIIRAMREDKLSTPEATDNAAA